MARTRFGCSVSMRISASFMNTMSTPPIVRTSESRVVSIQRFIESRPATRAPVHCSRTSRWRSGWMLARNSVSACFDSSDSLGWKSPKTFSWVSSVWAWFRSYS